MRSGDKRWEALIANPKRRPKLEAFVHESGKEPDEALEDFHDLAVIERRKDEPTIPLEEVERRLKKNRLKLRTVNRL